MLIKSFVGVMADSAEIGMHRAHVVGEKCPTAVVDGADALAVASPALGVQWHTEWQYASDPISSAILRAFGAACRAHHRVGFGMSA